MIKKCVLCGQKGNLIMSNDEVTMEWGVCLNCVDEHSTHNPKRTKAEQTN